MARLMGQHEGATPMPSPFPGMDPYLEGRLWPDVHAALAATMRQRLVPLVRPRYTVRLGVYVAEDRAPEAEIGIMYPDVEVLLGAMVRPGGASPSIGGPVAGSAPAGIVPAPLTIPLPSPVEVRLLTVEVRDTATDTLVTAIEVLSPINKTGRGLTTYRRKRERLRRAGVHLLEIDLLRRGTRPVAHALIPPTAYLVTLTRAEAPSMAVWPVHLQDRLPTVPVPLQPPDDDVALDLQATLDSVYETAAYELSIDYQTSPPPPALGEDDTRWIADLLHWRAAP